MQMLARCLAREQAGEGRDQSAEIGWVISAVRWLSCRLRFLHWFLVDVHASAFCIGARATCSS
jgi:hypothetical protein